MKDRIGVLFGGRSQEHEISVLSAASLMDAIDRDRHEVVPVAIGKGGGWYRIDADMSGLRSLYDSRMEDLIPYDRKDVRGKGKVLHEERGIVVPDAGGAGDAVSGVCDRAKGSCSAESSCGAVDANENGAGDNAANGDRATSFTGDSAGSSCGAMNTNARGARPINIAEFAGLVDFVFPMLHGPFGEDGTVQGLFETIGKPYAGCGVCSSAVAMDKIMTKDLLSRAGLPVLPYTHTTASAYRADTPGECARIEAEVEYPVYVKPANMGSSVGIRRACSRSELIAAIDFASGFDRRVLVEQESKGREFETAVLGNEAPGVGAIGEIVTGGAFYDYETKYERGAFELAIPADIPVEIENRIKHLALSAFQVLDGAGFARVDFFAGDAVDDVYINEMNTIPGFTQYSMFPRLWEAAGISYPALIEQIIALGYERHGGRV